MTLVNGISGDGASGTDSSKRAILRGKGGLDAGDSFFGSGVTLINRTCITDGDCDSPRVETCAVCGAGGMEKSTKITA